MNECTDEKNGTIVNILFGDRSFVKIVGIKEVDINPKDLTHGDIFCIYTDDTKKKLCNWGRFTTFRYLEEFINEEDVEFVTCKLVS